MDFPSDNMYKLSAFVGGALIAVFGYLHGVELPKCESEATRITETFNKETTKDDLQIQDDIAEANKATYEMALGKKDLEIGRIETFKNLGKIRARSDGMWSRFQIAQLKSFNIYQKHQRLQLLETISLVLGMILLIGGGYLWFIRKQVFDDKAIFKGEDPKV